MTTPSSHAGLAPPLPWPKTPEAIADAYAERDAQLYPGETPGEVAWRLARHADKLSWTAETVQEWEVRKSRRAVALFLGSPDDLTVGAVWRRAAEDCPRRTEDPRRAALLESAIGGSSLATLYRFFSLQELEMLGW